jgi:hypothetical protein
MKIEPAKPSPDYLVMHFGADRGDWTAEMLASACCAGVAWEQASHAALAKALKQGQRCLVFWSDPQDAIAEGLRQGQAPDVAVRQWCQAIEPVMRLFRRYRRRMVLADALLVVRGSEAELAQLGTALSLAIAPRGADLPAPSVDLARAIAELVAQGMLVSGSELSNLWEELLAASHVLAARAAGGAVDLGAANLTAAYLAAAKPRPASAGPDGEVGLLRGAMVDMAETLAAADARGTDALRTLDAETARVDALTEETALLRAQLVAVNAERVSDVAAPLARPDPMGRNAADLSIEVDLLRAQLRALTTLLEQDRRNRQVDAVSPGLSPADAAHAMALLHDQLAEMQRLLEDTVQSGNGAVPANQRAEAAIAALLAENLAEMEQRLRLENDLAAAQKSLRVLHADRTAAAYRLT